MKTTAQQSATTNARAESADADHSDSAVLAVVELGFQWPTLDPFLFCAHHDDAYPEGDGNLGPVADLSGRDIGQDFSGRDGFSMYHGNRVPGFPSHPHRGFETVTFVRKGLIDHSDSLGAAARFGRGDVQWLTAGAGIQHSEMFPLVNTGQRNPLELFQIWLNLPASDKFVDPYFTMLWDEELPVVRLIDGEGHASEVTVIAGAFGNVRSLAPPPNSWASRDDAEVAIWHFHLEPRATVVIPGAGAASRASRFLYMFEGDTATIDDTELANDHAAQLTASRSVTVRAGFEPVEMLLLQGAPIAEPVARYGPFVMNTEAEIRDAFDDYRRTEFGGWPWPDADPDHGVDADRFARHPDGRFESPDGATGAR